MEPSQVPNRSLIGVHIYRHMRRGCDCTGALSAAPPSKYALRRRRVFCFVFLPFSKACVKPPDGDGTNLLSELLYRDADVNRAATERHPREVCLLAVESLQTPFFSWKLRASPWLLPARGTSDNRQVNFWESSPEYPPQSRCTAAASSGCRIISTD